MMGNSFKCILCVSSFGICFAAIAQDFPKGNIDPQLLIEELFDQQSENTNYEELYESLLLYYSHPIDINRATKEELLNIFVITNAQIDSLISYRNKYGKLISLYELQAVPGFRLNTIRKLAAFLEVNHRRGQQKKFLYRLQHQGSNYWLIKYERSLQNKKGYLRNPEEGSFYIGSPYKVYSRVRIAKPHDYSFGVTMEKDAGESFRWSPTTEQYGFDFYSAHAMLENRGIFNRVILGDYQMQFGQGLLLSSGFNVGKGSETVRTVRRNNIGIRPYTSVLESRFFRGGAATYQFKRFELTPFYSYLSNDFRVSDTEIDSIREVTQINEFTSLPETGFHRTASELSSKSNLIEQNYGANLLYTSEKRNFQLGITFLQTIFDKRVLKKPTYYNQFDFSGTHNLNISLSTHYNWRNFSFFGEFARSSSGGTGSVFGFASSLSAKLELAMVLRNYDPDFHSFYGASFGENTRNANEKGIYWGLKVIPNTRWKLTAYFDYFEFPWLKYGVKSPSSGIEYLSRISYKPSRNKLFYFQFREERKGITIKVDEQNSQILTNRIRRNYVLNMDYPISENFSAKTRVQWSSFSIEDFTSGMALAQDINYKSRYWSISSRIVYFHTDNFDNRQYMYEKDVLYTFSIPAYSGKGMRYYLVLQIKPTRQLTLWAKFAETIFVDRQEVGSGLEEINGNVRSDIKIQARYTFW